MTKRTNFNTWPENMFVCLQKRLPRPLVETGPCNHFTSFGKLEKKQFDQSVFGVGSGVCSEINKCQSSLGACSLVRSLFRVRPEFVRRLSGVCSEFVRSSFGVCSELVRSWLTATEKCLLRKKRSALYSRVCDGVWPKPPKMCPCRICCRSLLSL